MEKINFTGLICRHNPQHPYYRFSYLPEAVVRKIYQLVVIANGCGIPAIQGRIKLKRLEKMTEASASEGRGQGAGGRRVFLHPFPLWVQAPSFKRTRVSRRTAHREMSVDGRGLVGVQAPSKQETSCLLPFNSCLLLTNQEIIAAYQEFSRLQS